MNVKKGTFCWSVCLRLILDPSFNEILDLPLSNYENQLWPEDILQTKKIHLYVINLPIYFIYKYCIRSPLTGIMPSSDWSICWYRGSSKNGATPPAYIIEVQRILEPINLTHGKFPRTLILGVCTAPFIGIYIANRCKTALKIQKLCSLRDSGNTISGARAKPKVFHVSKFLQIQLCQHILYFFGLFVCLFVRSFVRLFSWFGCVF